MEQEKFVGRAPDYKGDGVAVWVKQASNGKTYLSIKVLGSVNVAAFKNEPKEEPKPQGQEQDMSKLV